tara:strand:+ start:2905 stop:3306 length:402 start_codon:yes stop_codon:yes gene_type:complete
MLKEKKIPRKVDPSRKKAILIADFVSKKKASDISILDIRDLSGLCDYFVLCSGDSSKQVEAIYRETIKTFKKDEIQIHHFQKDEDRSWILLDFFDVILHIFLQEKRAYYNLEYLWSQAKRVRLPKKITSTNPA